MGQGTGSSAGSEEGGMGIPLIGALFGGGGSGGGGTMPGGTDRFSVGAGRVSGGANQQPFISGGPNDPGGNALNQGPSLMDKLKAILSDPKTLKALGNTAASLSNTINHANQIPGHVAPMLMNELQNQQGGAQYGVNRVGNSPYMGDVPQFDPSQAAALLRTMGLG